MFTPHRWTIRLGLILALLVAALPAGRSALAQDGTALEYGDQISGEITADAPEELYTFEGSAGDLITIRMEATAQGLDSFLALTGPDGGEPLITDDDTAGNLNSLIGPFRLPADGTYTIIATRFMRLEGTSVGPYTLSLSLAQVNPLSLDETLTVELNDAAPQMFFTFSGQAGDVFSLEGRNLPESTADLRIDVRDPSNGYLNQGYATINGLALVDPLVLPVDGEYMVVVSGQPQGSAAPPDVLVRAMLTLRPVETTPIAFDEPVSAQVDDDAPALHYIFTASRGDLLRLSGTRDGDSQPFEVLLINPAGIQFYEQVYRYEGAAGDTVRVTLRSVDDAYIPGMDLQGPPQEAAEMGPNMGGGGGGGYGGGSFVMNFMSGVPASLSYEFSLPADGVYLFRVRNGSYAGPMATDQAPGGTFGLLIEAAE